MKYFAFAVTFVILIAWQHVYSAAAAKEDGEDDNDDHEEHDHEEHDHEEHDHEQHLLIFRELKEFIGDLESTVKKMLPNALEKEKTYDNLFNKVEEIMAKHKDEHKEGDHEALNLDDDTLRVLITNPDGDVLYDTAKADNTWDLYKEGDINENHADRQAIIDALKNKDGFGEEEKMSKTTGNFEFYVARRIGSKQNPKGVLRVSQAELEEEE